MNAQQLFLKVATHLLKQGERSVAAEIDPKRPDVKACAYRGENGLKCAVGCLIPDSRYSKKMENVPAFILFGKFPRLPKYFEKYCRLLDDLQQIHDAAPVEDWRAELIDVARRHNLGLDFTEYGLR